MKNMRFHPARAWRNHAALVRPARFKVLLKSLKSTRRNPLATRGFAREAVAFPRLARVQRSVPAAAGFARPL